MPGAVPFALSLFLLAPAAQPASAPTAAAVSRLEKNALTDGLVKVFPELADKNGAYIDFDKSGDSRTEPDVPEIVRDRAGPGSGIIQAQEILDLIVYKDNYRYLSVEQLQKTSELLAAAGKSDARDEQAIMTKKVARAYGGEIDGLLDLRRSLPERITRNQMERARTELREVMERMSKQYTEEADKEASATFASDMKRYREAFEVVRLAEEQSPMQLPFDEFDDERGTARANVVRIVGDEIRNQKERYIPHSLAIFSLGKIGGRSALAILVGALADPALSASSKDVIAALGVLGAECTPEVVERIAGTLDSSKDPEVKRTAIRTLGKVGSKEAVGMLKRYVENPPDGMSQLRTAALAALVDIAETERRRGISSLEFVPIFAKYSTAQDNPVLAALAIRGIALAQNRVPFEDIWTLLSRMGDNPDPQVIGEIVTTIQIAGGYDRAVYRGFFLTGRRGEGNYIVTYLQDCYIGNRKTYFRERGDVRVKIAGLLTSIAVEVPWLPGLGYLVPALVDEDPRVARSAAELLVQASWTYREPPGTRDLRATVAGTTYLKILELKATPKMLERGLQVVAKQQQAQTTVIEYVFSHLEDMDEQVVRQAIRALEGLIGVQTRTERYYLPKRLDLVGAIILKSTLPVDIRLSAIRVAAAIGYSDAGVSGNNIVKALLEVMQDRNAPDDLRAAAIAAFPGLQQKQGRGHEHWLAMKDTILKSTRHSSIDVRRAAVESLGKLGVDTADVREALYDALKAEGNREILREIVEAIGFLNSPTSAGPIRDFLSAAKDLDAPTKKLAVKVLGNCRDPEAVEVLVDALRDPDTAREAERGLEQMNPQEIQGKLVQIARREENQQIQEYLLRLAKR